METMIVQSPMPRPDYTFYHTPSIEEMRQRAITAMKDLLSVRWTVHKKIAHSKSGAVSGKRFIYEANVIHCGLPYTNGGKGLFQFMEYYDNQTGKLKFYGTPEEFNNWIGCTCAGGVMWGLSSVCHTLNGKFINFCMVPKYGCFPVGDYTFDFSIDDYHQYSTKQIIEDNGIACMIDAYTKIQPADAVTSSPNDHTMMCIDYPVVIRDEAGNIDCEQSYVMIQDQRGGFKKGFYDVREGDDLLHFSGRTEFKYTFKMLLDEYYIPVTTKEFMGQEPYERANVSFTDPACATKEQLIAGTVTSNYPMAIIKLIVTQHNGYKVTADRYMFDRIDPYTGLARIFPMERMAEAIRNADGKCLEIEVTAPNGEIVIPVKIDL